MLGSKSVLYMKPKLLLHSCCGPCSTAVIEKLLDEYDITVYYFNPSIFPEEEYVHRKEEQKRYLVELSKRIGIEVGFLEGEYIHENFCEFVKGLENAPEGGNRCLKCFEQRLTSTALMAKDKFFDLFDTTLSVSPHKNYDNIFRIGKEIETKIGIKFLGGNYKKQDGYKRSIELSKEYDLYRQNYCGCEFSKRD